VKLHFDAQQSWQLEAVAAVTEVFDGQPREEPRASPDGTRTQRLCLPPETLLANLREVQSRNGLPLSEDLSGLDLSVEMETGTGKTYTYLRTLYALNERFGWDHFCIAVPSVAIREGVLQTLQATASHFEDLFPNRRTTWQVYEGRHSTSLRSFARDAGIQILVLNIDAFNKATNLIYRSDDRLAGARPIDLIANTCPVVVVDEPQNMESPLARAALASLNPLCTLRYSATHRNRYHLVYQLDPVRAHDLGLVKSVEVCSVTDSTGRPWIAVEAIGQRPLRARVQLADGPKRSLSVRVGEDLGERAGRDRYDGWVVDAIEPDGVHFDNGIFIACGSTWGDAPDRIAQAQVTEAVRLHLEKELEIQENLGRGQMKVLSLFFIDRVARYTGEQAPIRTWFEAAWRRWTRDPRYRSLAPFPSVDQVQGGYFAQRRDRAVDTRGRSRADEDAYALIMRDKERLLDPSEPLRFVFSHSALREGWDNPNVFVLCTLANAHSRLRKRQEIGRGLRLPVRVDGRRCWRPELNRLTVVANHSYRRFAESLQREHRAEWGSEAPLGSVRATPSGEDFLQRWAEIHPALFWDLSFDTESFIQHAAEALGRRLNRPGGLQITRAQLDYRGALRDSAVTRELAPTSSGWPDLLAILSRRTHLSRSTVGRILSDSGRLSSLTDPEHLLLEAEAAIGQAAQAALGPGLSIERRERRWRLRNLHNAPDDATTLEIPVGFAVSTPLGSFRPYRALATTDALHLHRRTRHTRPHD